MPKPSIFFSHSSKDKEALIELKLLLDKRTSKTLDIFLSSDGQSIPFGTNWVVKIEQELINAKIMFIFITPNSINSKWIYFEAGYAYSKGIKVIPVGLFIDIARLSPPLSLLQGFNISSGDSLNNLIEVINKEFEYSFPKDIVDEEFNKIYQYFCQNNGFDNIVGSINASIRAYESYAKRMMVPDVDKAFNYIKMQIKENNMPSTIDLKNMQILLKGCTIKRIKFGDYISIDISPYEFVNVYNIIIKAIFAAYSRYPEEKRHEIRMHKNSEYDIVVSELWLSSLIVGADDFRLSDNNYSYFFYKNIEFKVCHVLNQISDYKYISIWLFEDTDVHTIINLVQRLVDLGIIYLANTRN